MSTVNVQVTTGDANVQVTVTGTGQSGTQSAPKDPATLTPTGGEYEASR